jgi:hypothetical protein
MMKLIEPSTRARTLVFTDTRQTMSSHGSDSLKDPRTDRNSQTAISDKMVFQGGSQRYEDQKEVRKITDGDPGHTLEIME